MTLAGETELAEDRFGLGADGVVALRQGRQAARLALAAAARG
jgi:hypothetical protein